RISDARDAAANRDICQPAATLKRAGSDAGNAVWNCHARQAGTGKKCAVADVGDTASNRDVRHAPAGIERIASDVGDAVGDGHASYAALLENAASPMLVTG